MFPKAVGLFLGILSIMIVCAFRINEDLAGEKPAYTAEGEFQLPEHYREWVYLTSGFDMSYSPTAQAASRHIFDNVFVNPKAYRSFLRTGTWPDKTMLVLENRGVVSKGSINQSGNYQSLEVTGLEVHVKDSARFKGKWAFFVFRGEKAAKVVPQAANCYSCHSAHAAVDTTFVQFYPTLLPVARRQGTLSAEYLKEAGTEEK